MIGKLFKLGVKSSQFLRRAKPFAIKVKRARGFANTEVSKIAKTY